MYETADTVQMSRILNSEDQLGDNSCTKENRMQTVCKEGLVHGTEHFAGTTLRYLQDTLAING